MVEVVLKSIIQQIKWHAIQFVPLLVIFPRLLIKMASFRFLYCKIPSSTLQLISTASSTIALILKIRICSNVINTSGN